MPTAYLGLGSNLGDRWAALDAAVRRLRAEPGLRVLAVSGYYETVPVDCPPGSGDYLNAAAAVETDRDPHDLLQLLHRIEHQLGRVRTSVNAPRTLDLDLLLYGDRVIDTPDLVVPHPRLHERAFVLVPLAEIADEVTHPVLRKSIQKLLNPFLVGFVEPSVARPRVYLERYVTPQTLAGQTALVTGSTSGIGASISNEFAAHGASVISHGRRPREGRHVAADLTDPTACDRLVEEAWQLSGGLFSVPSGSGCS